MIFAVRPLVCVTAASLCMLASPVGAQGQGTSMQIKENKTVVEGKVQRVVPSPDGWGVEAEIKVENSHPSAGYEDFLHAEAGSTITVFAPDPDTLVVGQTQTMSITVLGGPHGSRAVVQSAEPK